MMVDDPCCSEADRRALNFLGYSEPVKHSNPGSQQFFARHGSCNPAQRAGQSCPQVKQMSRNNAISRSDRVLFVALTIILTTASVAVGAGMTWRPVRPAAPPVAPAPPAPDVALDRLVADHLCLAEALYYEARGEGPGGQQAVAEVV